MSLDYTEHTSRGQYIGAKPTNIWPLSEVKITRAVCSYLFSCHQLSLVIDPPAEHVTWDDNLSVYLFVVQKATITMVQTNTKINNPQEPTWES